MTDFLGWASVVLVLSTVPVLVWTALRHIFSSKPVEEKYRGLSGGGLAGGFDAVWSPSAHEAAMERDRDQHRAVPAPTPDKGPGPIDDDHIVIDMVESARGFGDESRPDTTKGPA